MLATQTQSIRPTGPGIAEDPMKVDAKLGAGQAAAAVMKAGLAAERDSMHSPEHAEIVAKLIAKSS
jgi:hypothetical protein